MTHGLKRVGLEMVLREAKLGRIGFTGKHPQDRLCWAILHVNEMALGSICQDTTPLQRQLNPTCSAAPFCASTGVYYRL
jgi:hypothetical protein